MKNKILFLAVFIIITAGFGYSQSLDDIVNSSGNNSKKVLNKNGDATGGDISKSDVYNAKAVAKAKEDSVKAIGTSRTSLLIAEMNKEEDVALFKKSKEILQANILSRQGEKEMLSDSLSSLYFFLASKIPTMYKDTLLMNQVVVDSLKAGFERIVAKVKAAVVSVKILDDSYPGEGEFHDKQNVDIEILEGLQTQNINLLSINEVYKKKIAAMNSIIKNELLVYNGKKRKIAKEKKQIAIIKARTAQRTKLNEEYEAIYLDLINLKKEWKTKEDGGAFLKAARRPATRGLVYRIFQSRGWSIKILRSGTNEAMIKSAFQRADQIQRSGRKEK